MALSMFSFTLKDDKRLLQVNFFAALFWGLNGFLLGSLTALLAQLVGAFVTAYRLYDTQAKRIIPVGWSAVFLTVALSALSWDGWISAPVTLATVLLVFALALAKDMAIRLLFLAANTAFLVHAYLYGSTPQIIATIAAYPFLFFGIFRMFLHAKNQQGMKPIGSGS